ncbi:hypothetical protein Gbem_2986 [Citrifermentans bemidjiense Bem]|uniref:Uncharacterized protein n=1 Tax=Citrifermentans bemidjiense (strain ATCC BAA-1014 / DSM 16622 / JCM 12645 / Bem) TaxID=404380 RepID=B5E820_CITBB|nr:hypothetical protein [Citrifermentans bemidjiense]ACH39989.1 hypothetical protein Gbem_2986 [Citrifermentans bemidjiense Bem]
MSKTLAAVICILACFIAKPSFGSSDRLSQLFESKLFWENYKWGMVEDSQLYKSAVWQPKTLLVSDAIRYFYQTKSQFNSYEAENTIEVKSDGNVVLYNIVLNGKGVSNYDSVRGMCINLYGTVISEYDNTIIWPKGEKIRFKSSSWIINETIIELTLMDMDVINPSLTIVFRNKAKGKVEKPTLSLVCRDMLFHANYGPRSDSIPDVELIIDENRNMVTNMDNTLTDFVLTASENVLYLKRTQSNHFTSYNISRITGRLEGISSDNSGDSNRSFRLTGKCEKMDPVKKKF